MWEPFRLAGLGIWSGVTFALWPVVLYPLFRVTMPGYVWQGPKGAKAMALTFDDGPDPVFTPRVLEILKQNGIQATFFLVGERARLYPEVVARIIAEGHAVGNHSDSWKSTMKLSARAFEEDLLRAERSLPLTSPKLFRPAGGAILPPQAKVLRKHGYRCVLASALPFDPYRPPPTWIVTYSRPALRDGGILVLHDSGGDRRNTVAALPRIIQEAQSRGLGFVTVPEMLK